MTGHIPTPRVWFPAIRAGSGSDVFTSRLAQGLRDRGVMAEVTWLPHRAEYAPWTVSVPPPPPWATVVHVNSWLPARFLPPGLPLVTTVHLAVHDPAFVPFKSPAQRVYHELWVKRVERAAIAQSDVVTAVSEHAASSVRDVFGRADVIPIANSVDTDVFVPAQRAKSEYPFRLLFVGNWSKRKGADLIPGIMRNLGNDFRLDVVGASPESAEIALQSNIRFLGRIEEQSRLVRLYQEADALLFPTRLEGFGLVALEAMACGVPVVSFKGSGLPELVKDGETGFLCAMNDGAAIVQRLRELANDPALWTRMKLAARKRAERFSLRFQLDAYLNVYARAASLRGPAGR